MKHILFIMLIAWSLAMQASSGAEPFDSLSYAIGDYYTRIVAENEPKLQSQADREEYEQIKAALEAVEEAAKEEVNGN